MSAELVDCPFPWCESGVIPQEDGSSRVCPRCNGRGEIEEDDAWFYVGTNPIYRRDEVYSYWGERSLSPTAATPSVSAEKRNTLADLELAESESRKVNQEVA